jgi:hypothetical protein
MSISGVFLLTREDILWRLVTHARHYRTLAIEWPIESAEAALSEKDRKLLRFSDFISPFRYDEGL